MHVPAIDTRALTRTFRGHQGRPDVCALEGVSLQVEVGEIRGLLGPNGAGKTTLVKILSTVLLPTSGSASVLGHDVVRDVAAVRRSIGIVFGGERGLYWNLTGRQNLEYWGALYKVPSRQLSTRIPELLERVGLLSRADDLVEAYSRGMKQRLHLARGLISDAQVLFLDEPTTGMDPVASRDFRDLMKDIRAEGRTVLLTTHDMTEAEVVCDRVALIDHGRVLAVETPRTLATLVSAFARIDFEWVNDGLTSRLRTLPGVALVSCTAEDGHYRVELSTDGATGHVLDFLVRSGVTAIRTSRPSLEEVYLRLIGRLAP